MNQQQQQYFHQKFDDFHSSGPRPPVPGEESRRKMTETSHSDRTRDGSPPAYVRWAQKLAYLLEDGDGAELFKRYVELEGEEPSNRLKFYFACEGLKQQTDADKVTQLIGAIYRRFLKKAQPGSELYVNESLRNFIKAGLKNELELTPDIFDQMQADVANIIAETTYPHFLQSDLYLQYVQNMQSSSSSSSVIGSGSNCSLVAAASGAPSAGGGGGAAPGSSTAGVASQQGGGGGAAAGGSAGAGASCSLTSSSSTSELFLHSTSALPTVHEDAELANADSIEQLYGATGPGLDSHMALVGPPLVPAATASPSKVPMTLTKDALMATQKRRLEMRPPGPRGYSVYTAYASYNPVSRRDSELASLSSGRTDSDTMSLSSISTDGRPHSQRKHHHHHHSSIERRMMRENALTNEEVDTFAIIPRTHRHTQKQPPPMEFAKILINKLECVAREQEKDEVLCKKMQEAELSDRSQNKVLADAIRQKLQVDDDNDQDILDQHVSRVWSDLTPSRSPGTMSPCPPNMIGSRSRRHELASFGGAQSSMRHSKSMPEGHPLMGPPMQPMTMQMSSGSRKLANKWPSVNTDSGISLFSTDTLTKHSSSGGGSRGELSLGSSSRPLSRTMHSDMHTATLLQESSRRLEDETRRSKRYQYPQQASAIQSMPLPPVPSMTSSGSFGSSLPPAMPPPPIPAKPSQAPNEFTIVVYSFCDEEVPYRIKIPGTQPPTLKQFKDYLPKKGNYRFFFKTRCEDLDNPVIQEEVNSDSEPLPLFEGKVMGTVKPSE
ncbi:axin isoform X1 [Anopheles gambiae]|uniref:axin isoform X1 n=1 Tax=Anopheles gambiae TaxID=7165 RepID=UPI002AC8A202|nr:axin isoform X1 [Anopheles gambiae]XP_061502274.1 axin isoform X1 [Anopheles gambiae]XP_061502275.1 axin isoform X1 [Anopheles gambiae]XP_061502276.1 axin isoform X1 [Anopheles gambiae]XP_061502277.1 axin isoform X1 [Anopheles gambiae]XP_061502278.1 axin isoform X1 [Anopheles gambiae]XP_061502279.1 axin isoform X1 [Anopheles gambiae]XP_061502280.1 axin isoform X1 [Anopheles gambiae]XP_061502281.1 axin isoform X1 [Anopheles gambiae]XP_061502282.1 axin isoform X1 [Anopheles gambiae]XP_32